MNSENQNAASNDHLDVDLTSKSSSSQQTREKNWKPAKFISYETMGLTSTESNPTVRPCGIRLDGKPRVIKSTCLLARMKRLNLLK